MKCGTGLGGCGVRVLSVWHQTRTSCSEPRISVQLCICICVLHFGTSHASAQRMDWCSRDWLAGCSRIEWDGAAAGSEAGRRHRVAWCHYIVPRPALVRFK